VAEQQHAQRAHLPASSCSSPTLLASSSAATTNTSGVMRLQRASTAADPTAGKM
jgi:hypothetical protein